MDKIKLKRLKREDADEYISLILEENKSNSKILQYASGFYVENKKEYEDLITRANSIFVGIRNDENKLVGALGIENLFYNHEYEISFFIGKKYRGKHYASKSLEMLINNFPDPETKKIHFFVNPENKTSIDIISQKICAKFEGKFEDEDRYNVTI